MDNPLEKIKFDWTINVSSLLAIIVFLATIYGEGHKLVVAAELHIAETNIMWNHFVKEHKDLSPDEITTVNSLLREAGLR